MRLNFDCVRDIMLWVEDITTPTRSAMYIDTDSANRTAKALGYTDSQEPSTEQQNLLSKYSNATLVYHINYCIEAGLLKKDFQLGPEIIFISDLTPQGHEFLGNIRNPSNYDQIKNLALQSGIETLTAFITIAGTVTGNIISKIITNQ